MRSKEDEHDYRYSPTRSAAARARRCLPGRLPRELARTPRRQAQALRGARDHALQCVGANRRGRDRALVRRLARRRGARAAGGQLGVVRTVRGAQPAWPQPRRFAGQSRGRGRAAATGRRRDAVGNARQAVCSKSCSRPATVAGKIVAERGLKQTSDTGEIDARIDEISPPCRQGRAV